MNGHSTNSTYNVFTFFTQCYATSAGRGVGALFGGYLISNYGLPAAFRIFAYISLAGAAVYILVYYVYLKRKMAEKGRVLIYTYMDTNT